MPQCIDIATLMPVYSHSRLEAFENCPMMYRLRYIRSEPLGFHRLKAVVSSRMKRWPE